MSKLFWRLPRQGLLWFQLKAVSLETENEGNPFERHFSLAVQLDVAFVNRTYN